MSAAYVIASGKGGTGKTSFTAGVGSALAALGHRTLCIDADVGLRNLDIALGMSDRVLMTFADVIAGRCTLDAAAVQHPGIPELYLLTAPMGPSGVSPQELRDLVLEAKNWFEFILIDAPAGLGSGFHLAAGGADKAIIVSTTDSSSMRDAQRAVLELADYPFLSRQLVVNRVEKRLLRKLHRTIDDAMDTAGLPLLGVVPEDPKVRLATNREEPIITMTRKGAAAAYFNIAHRMCGDRMPLMRL